MKGGFFTLAIILLAFMNVLTFVYSSQAVAQNNDLQRLIKENPDKVVYVQAKDGYTPIKGKDYFDGAAGLNAMSFSITNTIVKQVAIPGPQGLPGIGINGVDGKDAPTQEIRINTISGDLESKLTDAAFWRVLVPCNQLQVSCPGAE